MQRIIITDRTVWRPVAICLYSAVAICVLQGLPLGGKASDQQVGASGSPPGTQGFVDNRGLNAPVLQGNESVPVGEIRALRLLQVESQLLLFAAGNDRVLQWWKIDPTNSPLRAIAQPTIRWPVTFGRGQIHCLDASRTPDDGIRVAFGGDGAYPSAILVVDSRRLNTPLLLEPPGMKAVHQRVRSIRFHPDHPDLFAAGYGGDPAERDARVILWQVRSGAARQLLNLETGLGYADAVAFSSDGRVAACEFDTAPAPGTIHEWQLNLKTDAAGKVVSADAEPARQIETGTELIGLCWSKPGVWQVATRTHGLVEAGPVDFNQSTITNRTSQQVRLISGETILATLAPSKSYSLKENRSLFAETGDRSSPAFSPLAPEQFGGIRHLDIREAEGALELGIPGNSLTLGTTIGGRKTITGRFGRFAQGLTAEAAIANHATGKETTLSVPGIQGPVTAVALSDDGRFAAVAARRRMETADGKRVAPVSICLFDIESGALDRPALTLPPDGSLFVSRPRISSLRIERPAGNSRRAESIHIGFDGRLNEGNVDFRNGQELTKVSDDFLLDLRNRKATADHALLRLEELGLGGTLVKAENPDHGSLWWVESADDSCLLRQLDAGPNTLQQAIRLPRSDEDGFPSSAVPFEQNAQRRLAVGYALGKIAVWDPESGKLLRRFHGHDGPVLALDVSADGEWLASGGEDGMMRGWSLLGLERQNAEPGDTHPNELGISLKIDGVQLIVDSVQPGWPGFYAGFKSGDEITSVHAAHGGHGNSKVESPDSSSASTLASRFRNALPGQQLVITVRSNGREGQLYSTLEFEPLFELWPRSDGHWLISTPQKYFAVSSRFAMQDFGWNVNLGRSGVSRVRFFPLETLQADFQQPLWVERFIQRRRVVKVSGQVTYPPSVFITAVRQASTGNDLLLGSLDEPSDLEIDISISPNSGEQLTSATLWCNGRLITELLDDAALRGEQKVTVTVPSRTLRRGAENLLVASVTSRSDDRELVGRDVRAILVSGDSGTETRKPQFHFVGVGVTELDRAADFEKYNLLPLRFAANDAWHLGRALKRGLNASGEFAPGLFRWAVTEKDVAGRSEPVPENSIVAPTREQILGLLDELTRTAASDDLVCVFLAGHGVNYRQTPNGDEEGFFFAARDTDVAFANAVTGDDLFQRLTQLSCPVIVLIDACQSGGISSNAGIRTPGQLSLGPEIIASSQSGQLSYEAERIRESAGEAIGHGLFTAAALEVFGEHLRVSGTAAVDRPSLSGSLVSRDLDKGGDGRISISELAVFLQSRVPQLQEQTGFRSKGEDLQIPEILPSITFSAESIHFPVPTAR